jgi:hypothetical protein
MVAPLFGRGDWTRDHKQLRQYPSVIDITLLA